MSTWRAGGLPVLELELVMPRRGLWTATVRCEGPRGAQRPLEAGQAVTLACGAVTLSGTAYRAGSDVETTSAMVVAGRGGWRQQVAPRYYRQVPLRVVLSDLASEVGEAVAASSSTAVLGQQLRAWVRPEGTAGDALRALEAELGFAWRATDAGELWVGEETWPATSLGAGDVLASEGQADGVLEVLTERCALRPGTVLDGRRIGAVVQRIGSAELWTETESDPVRDRIAGALRAIVRAEAPGRAVTWYRGRVVAQSGQTVDVRLDDASMPGLTRVPLWHGLPGIEVTVPAGLGVLVGFEGRGYDVPIAALWEPGSQVTEIKIAGGAARVARVGDDVDVGTLAGVADLSTGVVTLTYVPPGGAQSVGSTATLAGVVTSGTPKVLA